MNIDWGSLAIIIGAGLSLGGIIYSVRARTPHDTIESLIKDNNRLSERLDTEVNERVALSNELRKCKEEMAKVVLSIQEQAKAQVMAQERIIELLRDELRGAYRRVDRLLDKLRQLGYGDGEETK